MKQEEWNAMGWECPRCHSIWSPFVKECKCPKDSSKRKDNPFPLDEDDIGHSKPYVWPGPTTLIRLSQVRKFDKK